MRKFKIEDISATGLELFIEDIVEANDESEACEKILNEIYDNLANYIDIELEEQ